MDIRHTKTTDLNDILNIFKYARGQMKLNGNPNQWKDNRPAESLIIEDIEKGNSYVIENEGSICGVFTLIIGEDPTYKNIDGKWLNDEPYGTIHRIASNGLEKGIFSLSLNYSLSKISNIRIDTHSDNKIMQHLIEKNGFIKCGIIYVDDGTLRIAYHKIR